jgi:hypothetical protein
VGLYAGGHRIRDMFLGNDSEDLISPGDAISLRNDRHHGPVINAHAALPCRARRGRDAGSRG